jgi:hypothetical protein
VLLGQLARPRVCLGCRLRYVSFCREQRHAAGQLQFDLSAIPRKPFRQCRECRETAIEMADCFEMGGPLGGMPAGLQPLIDRALGIAGGGQMMRQELGLALDEIGEMLLQRPPMKVAGLEILRCDAGWRNYHFLKLTTDDGIIGWSEFDEGFGSPGVGAVIERLAVRVVGQDAFDHERIYA